MAFTQIKSLDDLKQKIYDGVHDYFIRLNGGARSSKFIDYSTISKKFYICNEIDGSEQELTETELMSEDYTNIGKALKLGALWAY